MLADCMCVHVHFSFKGNLTPKVEGKCAVFTIAHFTSLSLSVDIFQTKDNKMTHM